MTQMTIYKYQLPMEDQISLELPEDASILKVAEQYPGQIMLWALCDPMAPPVERCFAIVGTGHPVPLNVSKHLDSVVTLNGAFVWHVFECEPVIDVDSTEVPS